MEKKYTAVVIGCGRVGATFEMNSGVLKPASHAGALMANPRTELLALVDPDPQQLSKAGDYYKVAVYSDARACLLELRPDIVSIATPPGTHEDMVALALELKIPLVICEKPVSETLEGAERMIALAKASQSTIIVNHQRRFLPLFREAKERIAAGELGNIEQVSCYYSNGLLNNGTHVVDLLHFLLDDSAAWALGIENVHNTAAPFGNNIDGLVGFKKGAVATLQSLNNNFYSIHDMRIYGSKGALVINQYIDRYEFRFEWTQVQESSKIPSLHELNWPDTQITAEVYSMLAGTIAHAIDCLDKKTAPYSTLEDGFHTMQVLDALVKSAARAGEKILLD